MSWPTFIIGALLCLGALAVKGSGSTGAAWAAAFAAVGLAAVGAALMALALATHFGRRP